MAEKLKPAIIIGSGFHRHVFGDVDRLAIRPLYNWNALVDEVAVQMGVAVPLQVLSPVQRWETTITRAVREGYKSHKQEKVLPLESAAHVVEDEARKAVASILIKASQNYPGSTRSAFPLLDQWGSIISLNFDAAWLAESKMIDSGPVDGPLIMPKGKITSQELNRLTFSKRISAVDGGACRRIWFPNGSCFRPVTIRMGLHDYGSAAHSIQLAFSLIKKWERQTGIDMKNDDLRYAEAIPAFRKASEGVNNFSGLNGAPPFPLSWVADFLYRPLVFAGVGLSDQESGLWWLLAQRARNLSRINEHQRSYILVSDTDRPEFWRSCPFGIEPIFCSNWEEGWEKLSQMNY